MNVPHDQLIAAFTKGLKAGLKPNPKQDDRALSAVTRRSTSAEDRAYWTGYFCVTHNPES